VIGKFGVGLKDALATFERRQVGVGIRSRHGVIMLERAPKHDFGDVVTLHAVVSDSEEPTFVGTDVTLNRVTEGDIATAKSVFLNIRITP